MLKRKLHPGIQTHTQHAHFNSLNLHQKHTHAYTHTHTHTHTHTCRGNFTCTGHSSSFHPEIFAPCLEPQAKSTTSWLVWATPTAVFAGGFATALLVQFELYRRKAAGRQVSFSFSQLVAVCVSNMHAYIQTYIRTCLDCSNCVCACVWYIICMHVYMYMCTCPVFLYAHTSCIRVCTYIMHSFMHAHHVLLYVHTSYTH